MLTHGQDDFCRAWAAFVRGEISETERERRIAASRARETRRQQRRALVSVLVMALGGLALIAAWGWALSQA